MAKIVLDSVASGYDLSKVNSNFQKIANELEQKVLYRDNPLGEANTMQQDLDMNGLNINNVGTLNGVDATVLSNLDSFVTQAEVARDAAIVAETNAESAAAEALNSASVAASQAESAANSASQAAVYSSLGLSVSLAYDFGSVADLIVYFPTDFGTIV